MHGDFSRSTFAAANGFRAVQLQQGRVLLDSDWNEQGAVTAHHDEVRTLDEVGRNGGQLAEDGGPGPFAILSADGSAPAGVPWSNLVVSPGRYYVDGVLAESWPQPGGGAGWPLTNQPYLPFIRSGTTTSAGLPEPPASPDGTRYALYLRVSDHEVTADEMPALRESALGGPDTSTRAQKVWQVQWERLEGDLQCTDLHADGWLGRTPRTLVAGLRPAQADPDPCRITATGGYTRLENQLYRVQIYDPGNTDGAPTFLWSRENGSVVARLVDVTTSVLPGVDAVLGLDRVGRDDELSFHQGDLVEVTSTDLELRDLPGFLARAGAPDALDLPVTWLAASPASLADLGRAPIVRRWEGGPVPAAATASDLEEGITVSFPEGGQAATGDYWLIPARSVRLAYGLSELAGTIDWPSDAAGPKAMPPAGPSRLVAPLAILHRAAGTWTRESDCRLLFPPLTGLVSIDLVGGDGQEALPGNWLDEAVRVVVRNGGVPVAGAAVRFTVPGGGQLADAATTASPPAGVASPIDVVTGTDGVAAVRWILDPGGPTTQTILAQRLNDHGLGVDVVVQASARLSVASQVAWSHGECQGFAQVTTVAGALDQLVTAPEVRLLGGDGQDLSSGELVLPQPVRVIVDNPCGPMPEVPVTAQASGQALVLAATEGEPRPADLTGSATGVANTVSGVDGGALFWWQPDLSGGSDTLQIRLPGDDLHAPIVLTAQSGPRRPGVHLSAVTFGNGQPFTNDVTIPTEVLVSGIVVTFDGALDPAAGTYQPAVRVELELPWPLPGDGTPGPQQPIGTHTVTLSSKVSSDGKTMRWDPADVTSAWIQQQLWQMLYNNWAGPLLGRFILDGWALPTLDPRGLQVNSHADAIAADGHTQLQLPTNDEVTGGTFVQWFWLDVPVISLPIPTPPVVAAATGAAPTTGAETPAPADPGVVVVVPSVPQ